MEQTREKSIFSRIFSGILTAMLTAAIGFSVYVVFSTAHGKVVDVFGKCIFVVTTGSMEPSIHTGECIEVSCVDVSELRKNDIIAFYSEQNDIFGKVVTHRIVDISDEGFVTRGDANPVNDSLTVRPQQVIGKYTGKARFFTWLYSFGDFRKLALLAIMLTTTAIAFYEVHSLAVIGKEIKDESLEQKKERLMREAIEKEKQRLAEEGFIPDEEDEVRKS